MTTLSRTICPDTIFYEKRHLGHCKHCNTQLYVIPESINIPYETNTDADYEDVCIECIATETYEEHLYGEVFQYILRKPAFAIYIAQACDSALRKSTEVRRGH